MKLPTLIMVLPAYNEEGNLGPLVENLEAVFYSLSCLGYERRYVIVDDGSTDGTPRVLAELQNTLPITVIRHEPNQGLGATIRDGLKKACEIAGDEDVVFTMDADNTHPAGLLKPMTQLVQEGNDVVIGSRYRAGSRVVGLSRWRALMSWGARVLFQLIFPIPGVRDYTCGYRAHRAQVLKEAFRVYGDRFVEHSGFQCMADILLRLSRLRVIMNEVPMILRYDQRQGTSKMRVGRTVFQTMTLLLKRRFERGPREVRG